MVPFAELTFLCEDGQMAEWLQQHASEEFKILEDLNGPIKVLVLPLFHCFQLADVVVWCAWHVCRVTSTASQEDAQASLGALGARVVRTIEETCRGQQEGG